MTMTESADTRTDAEALQRVARALDGIEGRQHRNGSRLTVIWSCATTDEVVTAIEVAHAAGITLRRSSYGRGDSFAGPVPGSGLRFIVSCDPGVASGPPRTAPEHYPLHETVEAALAAAGGADGTA